MTGFWRNYMSIWFNKEMSLTNANYVFIGFCLIPYKIFNVP